MSREVSRREFVRLMGAAGMATLASPSLGAVSGESARPNILFIMTDDHAAHALSCYGSRINSTPNMDRIAREGILFRNSFITNSLCAPSRATLLTGKYSHLNGVPDNVATFDGGQMTFPKLLREAGYKTLMIGKWHLKSDPTGFDYWNILPGQGAYHNPVLIEMGENRKHEGYATDIITDIAIAQLKEHRDTPFCMLLHHKAPHRNWQPDAAHAQLYADRDVPEPESFNDDYQGYEGRSSAAAHADMRIADMPDYNDEAPPDLTPDERKKWNYQRYIKDYLRTIASVDDNIGRVLDYLDESGLAKNTLVIYTSDNGFFLGDHGWFDKRFMYEESLRVPLVARLPGVIPAGSVSSEMVLNVDFAPTFLDFAGLQAPSDMQGRSIRPLLRGKTPPDWRQQIYYHYYEYPLSHRVREHYGIRTRRYKLIHYSTIDEWELFDLEKDPDEVNSVYGDPAYRYRQEALKRELERLRRDLKVPGEVTT